MLLERIAGEFLTLANHYLSFLPFITCLLPFLPSFAIPLFLIYIDIHIYMFVFLLFVCLFVLLSTYSSIPVSYSVTPHNCMHILVQKTQIFAVKMKMFI